MDQTTAAAPAFAPGRHISALRADLAAKVAQFRRLNPTEPAMVLAGELGFLDARAEHLALQLDAAEAEQRARVVGDHSTCAGTLGSAKVTLEYWVDHYPDGELYVITEAVHVRGQRIEISPDLFSQWQLDQWQQAAEAVEFAASDDVDPPDYWRDAAADAGAAEDRFIAERDHAHYSREAA